MKSILVPIDFSPLSLNAIPAAADIAEKTGAKLILVHNVVDFEPWKSNINDAKGTLEVKIEDAKHQLQKLVESGALRSIECQPLVTVGITHEQITTKAYNLRTDLIVMGSHGNTPSGKHFVDSNIQKILRESPCPVMTINDSTQTFSWTKLLVPLSFNEKRDREFEDVIKLARSLGSTVVLFYVNMPAHFKDTPVIEEHMNRIVKAHPDINFEKAVYDHHELETAILKYCTEVNAGYIAMMTHDHKRQAKYLISTTETVAYHSPVPVISIPVRKPEPATIG
jgi:nucleotide-binding universal stress UspA family protein